MKISFITPILFPIILFFYFGYYNDGFLETITDPWYLGSLGIGVIVYYLDMRYTKNKEGGEE